MTGSGIYPALFAAFAITSQIVLTAFFAARRWRRDLADRWGWIAYALGLPAFGLGVASAVAGQPRIYGVAGLLFAAWAAYGATLDLVLHVEWRAPIRAKYFTPFVVMYTAAQMTFWIPLWYIHVSLWVTYSLLYAVNTALNVVGHKPTRPAADPTHTREQT